MTATRWRALCFVLGGVCLVQLWRGCRAAPSDLAPGSPCAAPLVRAAAGTAARDAITPAPAPDETAAGAAAAADADQGIALYGVRVPAWLAWFAPQPGEDLRSYRDRMLPLAQAAIAPQRARVARSRDSFAELVHLDPRQRAELDAATDDTATALEDRVIGAVVGGELAPATFKPMTGVAVARDLLDIVARGNQRFLDALRPDQRAALARHPFDFGDYLVFSTRWEDALKLL